MSQLPSLKSFGGRLMLTLPSHQNEVCHVEKFVYQVLSKFNVNQEIFGNVLISLTEAVNNAIIHGNGKDKRKKVQVCFEKRGNGIAFQVSDEGEGFDYNNLPDPTAPENLERCGGRGVFMMRQLCDDMRYTNNGRTVEMRFRI